LYTPSSKYQLQGHHAHWCSSLPEIEKAIIFLETRRERKIANYQFSPQQNAEMCSTESEGTEKNSSLFPFYFTLFRGREGYLRSHPIRTPLER